MKENPLDLILETLYEKIKKNIDYPHLDLLNYYFSEIYDNGNFDIKRMINMACVLHHYRPEEITEIMKGITEYNQLTEPLLEPVLEIILDLNLTEQEPRYVEIKYARDAHILCEVDGILREVKSTNSTEIHSQVIAKINELERRLKSSKARIFFDARRERIEKEMGKKH